MGKNILRKSYLVTIEVDKHEAKELKNGKGDWDAYPNWDINYLGDEESFISLVMDEVRKYSQYSGISIDVKQVEQQELKG